MNKSTVMLETETKFGFGSIAKHAPKWVIPSLALVIGLISIIDYMVSGDPGLSNEIKIRVNHYLNGFTMLVTLLATMVGVDLKRK